MTLPKLGLNAAVVAKIRYAPTHSLNPMTDLWRHLIQDLNEEEAQQLPESLRYVLPLVSSDSERRRLLTSLAVSLDLYETIPGLLELAKLSNDPELILGAASLARHPGASPDWPNRVRAASEELRLSTAQARALEIRLNPNLEAADALEEALRAELWPGLAGNGLVSIVALDEMSSAKTRWELAASFLEAGATIRRLPADWRQAPTPSWLGQGAVIVSWSQDVLHRMREAGLSADASRVVLVGTIRSPSNVLVEADRILGGTLRLLETETEQPLLGSGLDSALIRLGAFDSLDMAFLGGATRGVVYRLAGVDALRPRSIRNRDVWSFGQLVALRTWRYFHSTSGRRRFPASLLRRLELLAEAPSPTDVGVTSEGRVLQRSNGDFHDVESGQAVFEGVVSLDRVFRPFAIGGREAPMLPKPSQSTMVHPTLFGGTPSLAELRLPVRTIMSVYRRHDRSVVQSAYPAVTGALLQECIEVGSIMEALR